MVRSLRIGALIAVLACTAPSWGQVLQQERYIMVKEDGKNPVKCKVLKTWKEKDGSTVSQVQPEGGGPVMIISDSPSPGVTTAPLKDRIGFWGKGSSDKPVSTEPAGKPGVFSRVFTKTPAVATPAPVIQPASGVKQTPPPPLSQPGLAPAKTADLRQSWGKVEQASSTDRASLPVARREGVDPMERPDVYTSATLPGLPAAETKLVPVSSPNALPTPPTPPAVTSTVVNSPPCGDCKSCQPKAGCATCQKGECVTCQGRSRLLRDFAPKETVVTADGEVLTVERRGLLGRLTGETVVKEGKPIVVKEAKPVVVKEKPVRVKETVVKESSLISPLPKNDGRIGVFSGLQGASAPRDPARRNNHGMPRGMGSVGAAGSPAVDSQTPLGAIVRQPDGTTSLVPASQIDPRVASVPVAASNAFTMNQSAIPYVAMTPDQAANAFSMATPTRPVPADMGSYPVVPNGLLARGMGGAEGRPPMMMAMAPYGPGHYPPQAMGSYAYPAQPMLHPGAMLPTGTAVASDMAHPANSYALASLRTAVLPSERERAAEALARANWKADPQVLPALVTAAQSDPAPMVRATCLRALGQMKANTVPVVEAVKTCREDRDARVRQEAEKVLPVLMKP
jgi:hypothetical protein